MKRIFSHRLLFLHNRKIFIVSVIIWEKNFRNLDDEWKRNGRGGEERGKKCNLYLWNGTKETHKYHQFQREILGVCHWFFLASFEPSWKTYSFPWTSYLCQRLFQSPPISQLICHASAFFEFHYNRYRANNDRIISLIIINESETFREIANKILRNSPL